MSDNNKPFDYSGTLRARRETEDQMQRMRDHLQQSGQRTLTAREVLIEARRRRDEMSRPRISDTFLDIFGGSRAIEKLRDALRAGGLSSAKRKDVEHEIAKQTGRIEGAKAAHDDQMLRSIRERATESPAVRREHESDARREPAERHESVSAIRERDDDRGRDRGR